MPPTRRTSLGRRTRNTASQRNIRANQTDEQREARNELERNRYQDRNVVFNPHRAAFSYNVAIDFSSEQIVAIGLMNIVCPHCKELKFKNEAPGLCCASGQVKLTPLVPPPEPLHSLVSGIGQDSYHFFTHIQQYNNCFQMTSFGATKVIRDNFMPTFKATHETVSMPPLEIKENLSVTPTLTNDYSHTESTPLLTIKEEQVDRIDVKEEETYETTIEKGQVDIIDVKKEETEEQVDTIDVKEEETYETTIEEEQVDTVDVKKEETYETTIEEEQVDTVDVKKEETYETTIEEEQVDTVDVKKEETYETTIEEEQVDRIVVKEEETYETQDIEELQAHDEDTEISNDLNNSDLLILKDIAANNKKTGKKSHICTICDHAFSRNDYLKTHMRIHTGEKPYSCNRCDMVFNRKSYLKSHMLVHTGKKLYSCNRCDKAFYIKGSLIQHMLVHSGKKPHSCNICNRAFIQKRSLNKHMQIHTGEKPYCCNRCRTSYKLGLQLEKP